MSLSAQLITLETSGLIRRAQMEPELEYLFRHALIQDAAYESTLKADRRSLHRVIGETLERLYSERVSELAPTLGHHFAAAGETERARKYFALAGDTVLAQYANAEAEQHYRAALNWATSEADKAGALSGLGQALNAQSRFEEAIQAWREAIGLYHALKDDDNVARLYARSARAAWFTGDTPRGLTLAREGLAAVANGPPTLGMALLLHDAGRACMFSAKTDEGLPFCRQALIIAEQLGNVEAQADILITLGMMSEATRQFDQAIELLGKAAELADSAHSLSIAARAHNTLGEGLFLLKGDLRAGRDYLFRAVELDRRRGSVANEFLDLLFFALPTFFSGDFAAVETMLLALRQLVRAIPDPMPYDLWLRTIEALLLRYRGELTGAIPMLRACHAQARQAGKYDWFYWFELLFAEALLESDERNEAGQVAADFIAIFAQDQWAGMATARCILSAVHLRVGRIEEARRRLTEAREKFGSQLTAFEAEHLSLAEARLAVAEKYWPEALTAFEATAQAQAHMGKRWYRAQTLREWAEAYLARNESGDTGRARELLREAQSEFEAMNVLKYAGQVRERLTQLEHGWLG